MNIRLILRSLPACLFILRCAAWLVPIAERAEWLAEWQAELWHVWHLSRRRPRRGQDATDFCLGAFQDAFWLRWNNPQSIPRRILRAGSASRCSFCLAIWAGASLCMCLFLPGARRAHMAIALSRCQQPGDDFKWRLCWSAVPDHTFPRLPIVEDQHPPPVYRGCLLSSDTQASSHYPASRHGTFDWPGQRQSF